MTVVSTKEFASNQEKYFDMAFNEQVYVQRESDNIMFIVSRDTKEYLAPDEDFRRAIAIDELFDTVKEKIRKKYPNK